jgi:hypothetical protein
MIMSDDFNGVRTEIDLGVCGFRALKVISTRDYI